jgi:muconolactone delta-isomerase
MQFMATISLDTARRAEVERLIRAESERVQELRQQGLLEALYVPDGSAAPATLWVVFNGDSRDAVLRIIENLPLYPYMHVDLTALRSLQGAGR